MERVPLILSSFCFLIAFAYTMYALGARVYRPSRFNYLTMLLGFAFQTGFLMYRGHQRRHCPITNLFEVIIFLSWAVVFLYLVIGTTYRVSLMGMFTSPLVFVLVILALVLPIDGPARISLARNPILEFHAAISMLAYGAFALAAVAGAMYLAQERQLKTRNLHAIFYHLPPISDLAIVVSRLLMVGFALLSVGLVTGFAAGFDVSQVVWGVAIWVVYAIILRSEWLRRISPRRLALLSVAAFSLALTTLLGLNFLGGKL